MMKMPNPTTWSPTMAANFPLGRRQSVGLSEARSCRIRPPEEDLPAVMDIDTGSFVGMTRSPRNVAERTMDPLHFRVTRRTYTSLPSSEQHGKVDDEGAMWRLIGTIRISKPIVGASFVVGRG